MPETAAELSPITHAFLLGVCHNDEARAQAVIDLVFHGASARDAGKAAGLSHEGMRRLAAKFKAGLDGMIRSGRYTTVDLIVKG